MRFTATTQLPLSALTTLARLKERYACGVRVNLDEAQRAMLDAIDAAYPRQKYELVTAAVRDGRDYLRGSDLFALASKRAAVEEGAVEQ